MANETAWNHFKIILDKIEKLNDNIKQIASDIDQLKTMKEEILDNAEFKAELKKIIDIYPDATMESLVDDYSRFQTLREWLETNGYI